MLKAKELRNQSLDELKVMYEESIQELYQFTNEAKLQKPESPHKKREKRKEIAKILTVINEKRREEKK